MVINRTLVKIKIDTWTRIAALIEDKRRLSCLSRTCRLARDVILPLLFNSLTFEGSNPRYAHDSLTYITRLLHIQQRIQSIIDRKPDLIPYIHHIELRNWSFLEVPRSDNIIRNGTEENPLWQYYCEHGDAFDTAFRSELLSLHAATYRKILKFARLLPELKSITLTEGSIVRHRVVTDLHPETLPDQSRLYHSITFDCTDCARADVLDSIFGFEACMKEIGEYKVIIPDFILDTPYFQTAVKESKLPIQRLRADTRGLWRMFPTKSMSIPRLSNLHDLWISTGSALVLTGLEAIIIGTPTLHRLGIDVPNWKVYLKVPQIPPCALQNLKILYGDVSFVTLILRDPTVHIHTLGLLHWSIWELTLREHYGKNSEKDEDSDETLVPRRILRSGQSNKVGSMWPFDFTSLSMQRIKTLDISAAKGLDWEDLKYMSNVWPNVTHLLIGQLSRFQDPDAWMSNPLEKSVIEKLIIHSSCFTYLTSIRIFDTTTIEACSSDTPPETRISAYHNSTLPEHARLLHPQSALKEITFEAVSAVEWVHWEVNGYKEGWVQRQLESQPWLNSDVADLLPSYEDVDDGELVRFLNECEQKVWNTARGDEEGYESEVE